MLFVGMWILLNHILPWLFKQLLMFNILGVMFVGLIIFTIFITFLLIKVLFKKSLLEMFKGIVKISPSVWGLALHDKLTNKFYRRMSWQKADKLAWIIVIVII